MPLHSLTLSYDDLTEAQWDRFWSRVGPSEEESDCRYWVDKDGNPSRHNRYGIFSANGRQYQMHRLSYLAVVVRRGETIGGDGLVVRHLCGDKRCCAFWHLEIGTHRDNAEDLATHRPSFAPQSIPESPIPRIDPVSDHALLYYIGDIRHPLVLTFDPEKGIGMTLIPSHVPGVWIDMPDVATEMVIEAAERRTSDRGLYVSNRDRHRLDKAVQDLTERKDRVTDALNSINYQAYMTSDADMPAHIEIHPTEALVPTGPSRRTFVLRGSDAQEWWLAHRSTPVLRPLPTPESEYTRAVRLSPPDFVGWCQQHIKRTRKHTDILPSRDAWSLMQKSYGMSRGQVRGFLDIWQVWGMPRRLAMQRAGAISGLGPTARVRPPRRNVTQGWRGAVLKKCALVCCT